MKRFLIYEYPCGDVKTCRVGCSWGAAFFTWIWAFVNQLWLHGVGGLIFVIACGYIARSPFVIKTLHGMITSNDSFYLIMPLVAWGGILGLIAGFKRDGKDATDSILPLALFAALSIILVIYIKLLLLSFHIKIV